MGQDRGFIQCRAALQHDDRTAALAPAFVRHTDHRGFGDVGQLIQNVLDLGRVPVFAAGDLHVLPPVDQKVIAIGVTARGIA